MSKDEELEAIRKGKGLPKSSNKPSSQNSGIVEILACVGEDKKNSRLKLKNKKVKQKKRTCNKK